MGLHTLWLESQWRPTRSTADQQVVAAGNSAHAKGMGSPRDQKLDGSMQGPGARPHGPSQPSDGEELGALTWNRPRLPRGKGPQGRIAVHESEPCQVDLSKVHATQAHAAGGWSILRSSLQLSEIGQETRRRSGRPLWPLACLSCLTFSTRVAAVPL